MLEFRLSLFPFGKSFLYPGNQEQKIYRVIYIVQEEISPTGSNMIRASEERLYDVVIVGAGLSGIGTAYWLQAKCPNKEYIILEGRGTLGGTWDLFRYPGVRSDSDMFTFGYRFKPWQKENALSDGASIRQYLQETAAENGIDKKICFHHRVLGANWSDKETCWTISVQSAKGLKLVRSRFLYMCSGYYDYEKAHRPVFSGEENFAGHIILPQFWPQDLCYHHKKIVVVGSGATAVTLVPTLAATAGHVTMLQRSPTYMLSVGSKNGFFLWLKKWLPEKAAYSMARWKNLFLGIVFYRLARWFPGIMKVLLRKLVARQLDTGYAVKTHFSPRYHPWDQRLCVLPDGDLFSAIRKRAATVVTDEISHFTREGICLQSGKTLDADIIVLATGLRIQFFGGATLTVNEEAVNSGEAMLYKGMMVAGVPNFAIAFGYINASWTLKTDLTANYICKLLRYMDRKNYAVVVPRRQPGIKPEPFLNFTSGYVKRAGAVLPKQGSQRPWRMYQNYFMDLLTTRFGRLADGVLQFTAKQYNEPKRESGGGHRRR